MQLFCLFVFVYAKGRDALDACHLTPVFQHELVQSEHKPCPQNLNGK